MAMDYRLSMAASESILVFVDFAIEFWRIVCRYQLLANNSVFSTAVFGKCILFHHLQYFDTRAASDEVAKVKVMNVSRIV
jgi:hypothetical protein